MKFNDPQILKQLDAASPAELDHLDFGVVRMQSDSSVIFYNAFESRLSGLGKDSVLGRKYFEQVAPCTNNYMVSQRFFDEPELDAQIPYIFTLRMKVTPVRLRLLRSASSKNMYLLVDPA